MNDNLPEGVTGTEYEIGGPEHEWSAKRECDTEEFSVFTISPYGLAQISAAIATLRGGDSRSGFPLLAVARLHSALSDVNQVEGVGPCPFSGDVVLTQYHGVLSWECPICSTIHEEEIE